MSPDFNVLIGELVQLGASGDQIRRLLDCFSAREAEILAALKPTEADAKLAGRRRADAERQRELREKRRADADASRDSHVTDNVTSSSPKKVSPDPSKNNPSTSLPVVEAGARADWPVDGWARFWAAWPDRKAKGAALTAFERVRKGGRVPFAEIMAGLEAYKRCKPADRPWCNASTWLNQSRWEDEWSTGPPGSAARPSSFQPRARHDQPSALEIAARLASDEPRDLAEFLGGGGGVRRPDDGLFLELGVEPSG